LVLEAFVTKGVDPMTEYEAAQVHAMLDDVKRRGPNSGLIVRGLTVVIRHPGSPYSEDLTLYDPRLLRLAIDSGLVERHSISGSVDWEQFEPS
jgi:hypothetical protein